MYEHLCGYDWGIDHPITRKVFTVDPTICTVTPFGSDQTFTIAIANVYAQFQAVPDQRKRRGVRYPLAHWSQVKVSAYLSNVDAPVYRYIAIVI
jgi:hypothetical protein